MSSSTIDPATALALVQPYYDALLAPTPDRVRGLVERATSPDWRNCTDEDVCETRDEAIARWGSHRQLIPDLDLEIRDVLVSGNKIVVRGRMTGTPNRPLMGVDPQGRSFRVMTVDIHEIADGKIVHSFHLEDWGRGIAQMRGDANGDRQE